MAIARQACIMRHVKAGWKFVEGLLSKGRIKKRPTALQAFRLPGRFDPRSRDVVAVRLGAVFVGPNRYRYGEHFMDQNGAFLDPAGCPVCGSVNKENAFFVREPSRNPFAKPWEKAWTYCRRCITPEEIERLKQQALAAAPQPKRRRQV